MKAIKVTKKHGRDVYHVIVEVTHKELMENGLGAPKKESVDSASLTSEDAAKLKEEWLRLFPVAGPMDGVKSPLPAMTTTTSKT